MYVFRKNDSGNVSFNSNPVASGVNVQNVEMKGSIRHDTRNMNAIQAVNNSNRPREVRRESEFYAK